MSETSSKLDYKKAYRDLYLPGTMPTRVLVPPMNFIMVDGQGDPNEENGEYEKAVGLLYALTYAIKMSPKGGKAPDGYFDYVVPPLEGHWWMADGSDGVDYGRKRDFRWISMIRQPEFVTAGVFEWACDEVRRKKKLETGNARLHALEEGLCVQCMHVGRFDDEPHTIDKIDRYIRENGLIHDIGMKRRHHEIYLGDPRKGDPDRMKTVLRTPVRERT